MKNKLGEIHCPNCEGLLTIWEAKTGSGFVNCGFCGLKAYNIQPKKNPEKETQAATQQPQLESDMIGAEKIPDFVEAERIEGE